MIKPIIYPYKLSSHTAKCLAGALNTKCVREHGNYVPKQTHLIINWGNHRVPIWCQTVYNGTIANPLNRWWPVKAASNKLNTFHWFSEYDIRSPEWTTDRNTAMTWMNSGNAVLCRNLLNSHSGKGIILVLNPLQETQDFPVSPLYVKYKRKRKEFRVHVFLGEVLDVQQKKKRLDFEGEVNPYIRSHSNGWIFAREDIVEPEELRSLAIRAVEALGLDFGAVDIIWNEHENKCYVLEVNTAPGLEGSTLQKYVDKIKQLCQTL